MFVGIRTGRMPPARPPPVALVSARAAACEYVFCGVVPALRAVRARARVRASVRVAVRKYVYMYVRARPRVSACVSVWCLREACRVSFAPVTVSNMLSQTVITK